MANFLLIHGSCHGAWCWRDTIPALEALGHSVSAIDLPSHGQDDTDPSGITLDIYAAAITAATTPDTILVGHSMAGYPITAAAERDPSNIARLVYLCAYVPITDQSLADRRRAAPAQPLMDAITVSDDRKTFTVDPIKALHNFYNDVEGETGKWAASMLCPQAILPQETVINLTPNSTALPRTYIRCNNDQTIPPIWQAHMSEGWGSSYDMSTGHSPFLADPAALAALLNEISAL